MTKTADLLLEDARTALVREVRRQGRSELCVAFAGWLSPALCESVEFELVVSTAKKQRGALQDHRTVAILGLAAHAQKLDTEAIEVLKMGLHRLAGRPSSIDGTPVAFCTDSVSLLGVALGTKQLNDKALAREVSDWLNQFLKASFDLVQTEDWQRCLLAAADMQLGSRSGIRVPNSADAADVRVALLSKSIMLPPSQAEAEADEVEVLLRAIREPSIGIGCERAALRLTALDWVRRAAPVVALGRVTAIQVADLLRRVPAGLRKWTWEDSPRTKGAQIRKWNIDNEYHVQNALWFLLAPIFPDLSDEQYLEPVGQKQPRADLLIPSLRLIVEVKFWRPGDKIQKIIEEISSDASLYLAKGSQYTSIIPFVWDDAGRSHEHDYLLQGLRKLNGILDGVIVSRPGELR